MGLSDAPDAPHVDASKISGPSEALTNVLSDISVPAFLYRGIPVIKVTSGGALKHRILTLSKDNLAFFITHRKVETLGGETASSLAKRLPIPLWTPSKGFATKHRHRYTRYLDVGDIDHVIREVAATQAFESLAASKRRDEVALTFFHHGMSESLNLLVDNPDHRAAVIDALHRLKSRYNQTIIVHSSMALLLRYLWYHIDQDQNGNISDAEFKHVCDVLNLDVNVRGYMDKAKCTRNHEMSCQECLAMLIQIRTALSPTEESWTALFGESSDGTVSPARILTEFLHAFQGERSASIEDAKRLLISIGNLRPDSRIPPVPISGAERESTVSITKEQFSEFLSSDLNSAYCPEAQALPDTSYWDQPISQYWINTSHNTYLLGDQLQSKSSLEAYARSLYRGCKCIEFDCWDGNNKDLSAVVYHGYTLTSKIFFVDILHVVKAYLEAHPQTLPIILSLENHCSRPYQTAMAQQMKEIFKGKLYVPSIQKLKGQVSIPLPSPNQLRGMVVVKGKRPPELDESTTEEMDEKIESATEVDPYDEAMKEVKASPSNKKGDHSSPIAPELARLTLFHGTKFKSFEASMTSDNRHMHSIGESKMIKILNKGLGPDWRKYNTYHMTRTYPAGIRVDSSNYNPTLAWAVGCQLVALNFQTPDIPLLLNDGRFRQAGGSGYVLKPKSVLGHEEPARRRLSVSVLSASCLPKPQGVKAGEAIDPYVRVELHDVVAKDGAEEDQCESWTTPTVSNNGFCPVWPLVTKTLEVNHSEVAMLLFQVFDDSLGMDQTIASCAIPVSCLRAGTRSVPLYRGQGSNTRGGPFDFATLLVRIEWIDVGS